MTKITLKISQTELAEIWLRNQKKRKRNLEKERFYLHLPSPSSSIGSNSFNRRIYKGLSCSLNVLMCLKWISALETNEFATSLQWERPNNSLVPDGICRFSNKSSTSQKALCTSAPPLYFIKSRGKYFFWIIWFCILKVFFNIKKNLTRIYQKVQEKYLKQIIYPIHVLALRRYCQLETGELK